MHKFLEKVEEQLHNISEKGINSNNIDNAYKLMDIYKNIKESEYYKNCCEGNEMYDARRRDSRGRYMDNYNDYDGRGGYNERGGYDGRGYNERGGYNERNYNRGGYNDGRYGNLDERTERYFTRMREGMESYNAGRDRYRSGDSQDRMIDGIEMTMSAICMFVESLVDFAETPQEKEVVRKHLEKMKKI